CSEPLSPLTCTVMLSWIRCPPCSTLFPYTTLFRSHPEGDVRHVDVRGGGHAEVGAVAGGYQEHPAAVELDQGLPPAVLGVLAEEAEGAAERLHTAHRGGDPVRVILVEVLDRKSVV